MKLTAPNRRYFRRPPRRQQQAGFFAKEGEGPAFFQPASGPRMKQEASFFAAKEPEEQETPAAKNPEEERMQTKAPEEEEVRGKKPDEEEPEAAKEKAPDEETEPVAAKCSCGCGGTGTCSKSAGGMEEQERAKAPATQATSARPVHHDQGGRNKECTPAQQSVAASSLSAARTLAGRAAAAADEVCASGDDPALPTATTSHYERWFGKYDRQRARYVRHTFGAITSRLGGTLHFCCDRDKNLYAYVRSGGRKKIYLGELFWRKAGGTGFDSKAGVILHEAAHEACWDVGDHGYGPSQAEELAAENPEQAVANADNYEYFAESL